MFAERWRVITCLLLWIWTLVPGWSTGTVIYCQEPICSCGATQHGWWPLNPSTWTQEGGLPPYAYSCLGQICKACFACQSLGLLELFFCLFSPDSFLSKQSRKKKCCKQFSKKGRLCFFLQEFLFWVKCWGQEKLRWIKERQLSLLHHFCLL